MTRAALGLLIVGFAVSVGKGVEEGGPVAGATPQVTFSNMRNAAANKNWSKFAQGCTEESQSIMIGAFAILSTVQVPNGDIENMKGAFVAC